MLRKFIIRFFLFLIPFYLIFAINYVVDPFNYNMRFDFGFNKDTVSMKMNYRLYKMLEYKNRRIPNIILGDSRMAAISTDEIRNVSGENYYNFGYGGATLKECIETFYYANSLCELSKVYIGIPFNLFSGTNSRSVFAESKKIADNPVKYYLNSFVLKASFFNLYNTLFHKNLYSEKPNLDWEAFWKVQIRSAGETYEIYSWPDEYVRDLSKVKETCRMKGIELVILIPPTHLDLQNLVTAYHLQDQYTRYKQTLRGIATVINYDTVSDLTRSRDNFKDPYHFNEKIMKNLVLEIWGRNHQLNLKTN